MGPIAVNRLIRRLRGHLAGTVAVVALATVIAAHHTEMVPGAMPARDMAGMHHDTGAALTMTACLGAFVALGAAVVAVGTGVLRLGRWSAVTMLTRPPLLRAEPLCALSRAGPRGLPLLAVWRI